MLSMQSTTIYCCVGGLCGAPLHGSWVLVVLKRALCIALSGAGHHEAPSTRTAEGAPFCRGGAPGSASGCTMAVYSSGAFLNLINSESNSRVLCHLIIHAPIFVSLHGSYRRNTSVFSE